MALLSINNLNVSFRGRGQSIHAVNQVSFSVDKGDIVGIVGESGCGKSALCSAVLRLIPTPPGETTGGPVLFNGIDLLSCTSQTLRTIRGNRISMVFQDPMTSLNPYLSIGTQIVEPLRTHSQITKSSALEQAHSMLARVAIPDPQRCLCSYPHELSGGMRQRVMIAMALITHPSLVIADEPTTALDVTIQAQILDLLGELSNTIDAFVIVTHNMGIVCRMCTKVVVMYAGRILESAPTKKLFYSICHPYTKALLQAVPSLQTTTDELFTIPGSPPDLTLDHPGCPFAPRCTYAVAECATTPAGLKECAPDHQTACLRVQNKEIFCDR